MGLTPNEVQSLIVIERVTASISITATLILLTTFFFIKDFRTLSNTLIFYASFANLFANVAALIGGSALSDPGGALCQFQGFLLEMFMQSDPLWSCAMAVNVYLVFFRRYDAARLKRLYWVYGLLCYGLPFIPAMFCLFYDTPGRGKMYGDATLWCWIDNEWALVRIYSYYLPVWIAILFTLTIYFRVGFEIYRVRAQIRALGDSSNNYASGDASTDTYASGTLSSVLDRQPSIPLFARAKTTEGHVVGSDVWRKASAENSAAILPISPLSPSRSGEQDDRISTISSLSSPPHLPPSSFQPISPSIPQAPFSPHPSESMTFGPIHRQSHPSEIPPTPRTSMDKVKWAYTKCALLFAVSILITWVPASINRIYGLKYPDGGSSTFGLTVASALVLPLQGFWNTVIYFSTSMRVTKRVIKKWRGKRAQKREKRRGTGAEQPVIEGGKDGIIDGNGKTGVQSKGKERETEMEIESNGSGSARISDRTIWESV